MANGWLDGADLTQRYDRAFPGVVTDPTIGVLHSTETGTWPAYSGGATAPNLTARWSGSRLEVRQHFPLTMSSRALRNLAGGVATNGQRVVQIELVGSCDRAFAQRYGYLYLPDAPPAYMDALAALMRQIEAATSIPRTATARPWLPYPASYGQSPARMSFPEWQAFAGWCAHQHVPENTHGDVGDLPIGRLLAGEDGDDMFSDGDRELLIRVERAARDAAAAAGAAAYGLNPEGGPSSQGETLKRLRVIDWNTGLLAQRNDVAELTRVVSDLLVPAVRQAVEEASGADPDAIGNRVAEIIADRLSGNGSPDARQDRPGA